MTTTSTTGPAWTPPQTNLWKYTGLAVGLVPVAFLASMVGGDDLPIVITALLFWVGALAAYVLPTAVASSRSHHHVGAIAAVNLLLGWTLIGWVVALAMAVGQVRLREA
ncbi:MAG TPA: superinfection immunity protein [Acidimicrobiia bacterium]|nr:superinfection immunity protein [Acidimicrobiia bacterium]